MKSWLEKAFVLTAVVVLAGIAALFTGNLTGAEYVALSGILSTVYGATSYFIGSRP